MRTFAKAEIEAFERDGAAVIRGVVKPSEIEAMRVAVDQALADSEASGVEWASKGGRFYNGFFHWLRNDAFRDLILNSDLGELAAHFLRARSVNFFYDQLLVKEPGTDDPTPWHQDSSYFPLDGGKLLSIWAPFDAATPLTGAVTYVKGSHRWPIPARGEPSAFADFPAPGQPIPGQELFAWSLEPGDVLMHDQHMIHGAPGNPSTNRRRALATRWADQDVRWKAAPDSFISTLQSIGKNVPAIRLAPGDPLDSPIFPKVWPKA